MATTAYTGTIPTYAGPMTVPGGPGTAAGLQQTTIPLTVGTLRVEKQTYTAKWASIWLSIAMSMLLLGYVAVGAAMGNTGTDANGNSVGVIFWLEFWQIPLVVVIIFGFAIAVQLLDIRSTRKSDDLVKAEKAVDRAFYQAGNTILIFAISASILFITSVASLAWRATLIFSCVAPKCFVGIYLRANWLFFIFDILTAIAAALCIGFGFYFWYLVKTESQQIVPSNHGKRKHRSASAPAPQPSLNGTYGSMAQRHGAQGPMPVLPFYAG